MTTYATRSPLQLLSNPHMMSEPRRSSRRLSARQPEKEDLHVANGVGHGTERGKGGQINGMGGKQGKASVNGTSTNAKGGRGKRKIGLSTPEPIIRLRDLIGRTQPFNTGALIVIGW